MKKLYSYMFNDEFCTDIPILTVRCTLATADIFFIKG